MSADPNIGAVERAIAELGALAEELILIGGCAVGFLVTDPAATLIRPTKDVDLLTQVAPLANYYEFCARLKAQGFTERTEEEVICRWTKGSVIIDVVPTDRSVLGFTNSWYAPAATTPDFQRLPSGKTVRMISAPYFLATKFEAFAGRAGGDFAHHDMEDIVTVIDGRNSIVDEVMNSDNDVRDFLRDEVEALLANPAFTDKLSWLLPPYNATQRQEILLERMRRIGGF